MVVYTVRKLCRSQTEAGVD